MAKATDKITKGTPAKPAQKKTPAKTGAKTQGKSSALEMDTDTETETAVATETAPETETETAMDATGPLEAFFRDSLKDIYWAEKALTESLPKMQAAATTDELQEAFEDHALLTKKHVSRLEKVFKLLGKPAEAKKCDAMQGLIDEGEKIIAATPTGSMTRDAALIIAAQKVEHYEIASYGGLVQIALTLNKRDVADLLETTLQEEEDTDMDLTEIAEAHINFDAQEETQEDIEDLNDTDDDIEDTEDTEDTDDTEDTEEFEDEE